MINRAPRLDDAGSTSDESMPISNDDICLVSIYLYGNDIALDDVSNLLQLIPTRSRKRGDIKMTSTGNRIIQRIGFWEYYREVPATQAGTYMADLLAAINCGCIVGQFGVEKAELDVFCALDAESGHTKFSIDIPSTVLTKAGQLGLDLILTTR